MARRAAARANVHVIAHDATRPNVGRDAGNGAGRADHGVVSVTFATTGSATGRSAFFPVNCSHLATMTSQ